MGVITFLSFFCFVLWFFGFGLVGWLVFVSEKLVKANTSCCTFWEVTDCIQIQAWESFDHNCTCIAGSLCPVKALLILHSEKLQDQFMPCIRQSQRTTLLLLLVNFAHVCFPICQNNLQKVRAQYSSDCD